MYNVQNESRSLNGGLRDCWISFSLLLISCTRTAAFCFKCCSTCLQLVCLVLIGTFCSWSSATYYWGFFFIQSTKCCDIEEYCVLESSPPFPWFVVLTGCVYNCCEVLKTWCFMKALHNVSQEIDTVLLVPFKSPCFI